jgi:hypothetical protein
MQDIQMAQSYMLSRLDELRAMSQQTLTKLEEMQGLLQALPAAETTKPSLLSRLQTWLPLLQQLGAMVIKHLITVLMIWYMIKDGGSSLTVAEMLLKLL